MMRYTGSKRIDFLITHIRITDKDPLRYLVDTVRQASEGGKQMLNVQRVSELLKTKFWPNETWNREESESVSRCYSRWLETLRIASVKDNAITWTGGTISVFDITALAELDYLQDRMLYDKLVESFVTPKNMLDVPHSILANVAAEKEDGKRGEMFEDFVAACFGLLGFTVRQKAGARESGTNLTYQSNRGGGDVALLSHFPIHSSDHEFLGSALACEAKSTEGQVGSKAVGQARNLAVKIEEAYKGYVTLPIVVSRSTFGYDKSGKDLAPPEVVLLNQNILLEVCKLQKARLEQGKGLILPVHVQAALERLVKLENLEPSAEDFTSILASILS